MNEAKEMQKLKFKTWKRIASLASVGVFAFLAGFRSIGAINFSFDSFFGIIVTLMAVAASVVLLTDRTSWLPFLGDAVIPPSVLTDKTPSDAAFTVKVQVPKRASHVMYWASDSAAGIAPSPAEAYNAFGNSGVVKTQSDGTAVLKVRCPGMYKVRGNKVLPRHVHYRAIYPSGIAGEVQTSELTCV